MPAREASASWAAGYRLLQERNASVPDALRAAAAAALPALPFRQPDVRSVLTTGIGSSSAHAKFLAHLLAARGLAARFVPAGAFVSPPADGSSDDVLIVFSQGLSPNARLALAQPRLWRHLVLVTAVTENGARRCAQTDKLALLRELDEAGVSRLTCPGENEYGTLVRLVGPMAGYVCAHRLAARIAAADGSQSAALDVEILCSRVREAPRRIEALLSRSDARSFDRPLAFLTSGGYSELVDNLRLKVMEGMLAPPPPVWDLVEFSHGPFQAASARRATFLALARRGAPMEAALLARLGAMLDPRRHRLLSLEAEETGPLAILEHEALVNELLLRRIAARHIDQVDWPGKGRDAPLYDVAAVSRAPGRLP